MRHEATSGFVATARVTRVTAHCAFDHGGPLWKNGEYLRGGYKVISAWGRLYKKHAGQGCS